MKLAANDVEIEVRAGKIEDVPLLISFIQSMARYEKLEVEATEESLRESLFSESPAAHSLLVLVDNRPAAYVIYFFSFASMVGKRGLWLDDLYVKPEYRGKGIGKALMAYMAEIAIQHECGRLEWMVLDWNQPAKDFYQEMGATVLDNWQICRLDEAKIASIAGQSVRVDNEGYQRRDKRNAGLYQ